jgi:hypothetical protein
MGSYSGQDKAGSKIMAKYMNESIYEERMPGLWTKSAE